jgi:acyl carrier protein
MDLTEIEERVLALVRRTVPGAKQAESGSSLVLLGEEGVFDSVTALELIVALEQEFSIVVRDEDLRPENLADVASIVAFVRSELSRTPKESGRG